LPGLEELPDTFLNTLAKALPHAIAVDGCLLLPVDSIHIELKGGCVVTGSTIVNWCIQLQADSLEMVPVELERVTSGRATKRPGN
jgi:hypothetical protein